MSVGANDPRVNFWAEPTLQEFLEQQGATVVQDAAELHGDFWPDDEPIEEFLAALDEWRGHRRNIPAA